MTRAACWYCNPSWPQLLNPTGPRAPVCAECRRNRIPQVTREAEASVQRDAESMTAREFQLAMQRRATDIDSGVLVRFPGEQQP